MPRKPSNLVICDHFRWNLLQRDDVYYADGRANKPSLGKHSLGTRDHEQALENLRVLDRQKAIEQGLIAPDLDAGRARDQTDMPVPTIAQGWERYMAHCRRPAVMRGASPATLKRYRAVRDKHESYCREQGLTRWNQIDKPSVEAYGSYLDRKGYAAASIYLEMITIVQVVKVLIEEFGLLPQSARFKLRLRRSHESDAICYTREQATAMLNLCRSRPDLQWMGDVLTALCTTGMRIGELAGLTWSDVDLDANTITLADHRYSAKRRKLGKDIRTTKGRRGRRIPIHPSFRRVLERLPRHADGKVFHGPRGGVLKPDVVRNVLIREVLTPLKDRFPTPPGELGFEHGRLHSCRHYFVSQAFLNGATESEIRSWVGHADSRIIERYRHLGDEESQRRMQRVNLIDEDQPTAVAENQTGHNQSTNQQ